MSQSIVYNFASHAAHSVLAVASHAYSTEANYLTMLPGQMPQLALETSEPLST